MEHRYYIDSIGLAFICHLVTLVRGIVHCLYHHESVLPIDPFTRGRGNKYPFYWLYHHSTKTNPKNYHPNGSTGTWIERQLMVNFYVKL